MVKRTGGALLDGIRLDRGAPQPLSLQISAGLRDLILDGSLAAGARLPATRTLARDFGVARATVVESFERLAAEGLIEMRVGSGSFVSRTLDHQRPAPPVRLGSARQGSGRVARPWAEAAGRFGVRLAHEPRPFTTALPAFDAFPIEPWSRLSARHWRKPRETMLGYGDPEGFEPLRHSIASHLRTYRGIDCDWRQIFVTGGAQDAFQVAARCLLESRDKVWFENPGAIGARNGLLLSGAELVPVPVDEAGIDVGRGLQRAPRFALAFVTPSHQQPLGVTMSLERRFALLHAAEQADAWIIEDDWDGEFFFSGQPLPTLKSIDSAERVLYVGSFSKSLFPSLRLGFMLVPRAIREPVRLCLEACSPGVPTETQAIVADFIREGHFAAHIRRMRRLYQERHHCLVTAVRERLSHWIEIVPTHTGMHVVAWLRGDLKADAVSAAAAARGVTAAPVSRFALEPIGREGLVLGFAAFTAARIQAGVAALEDVLHSLAPATKWTAVSTRMDLRDSPISQ
jgi:GntR family transcriptional regulator/MocR family aminotransferase